MQHLSQFMRKLRAGSRLTRHETSADTFRDSRGHSDRRNGANFSRKTPGNGDGIRRSCPQPRHVAYKKLRPERFLSARRCWYLTRRRGRGSVGTVAGELPLSRLESRAPAEKRTNQPSLTGEEKKNVFPQRRITLRAHGDNFVQNGRPQGVANAHACGNSHFPLLRTAAERRGCCCARVTAHARRAVYETAACAPARRGRNV